jgi:hypothetical protein
MELPKESFYKITIDTKKAKQIAKDSKLGKEQVLKMWKSAVAKIDKHLREIT